VTWDGLGLFDRLGAGSQQELGIDRLPEHATDSLGLLGYIRYPDLFNLGTEGWLHDSPAPGTRQQALVVDDQCKLFNLSHP
jgi:hypothetical protein